MAVGVALGTPLAESLSSVVQPKLVSLGWSSEDDSSLAEYILLMLVNGKTQDQIASELASDLLPDETGTLEFSKWLFDQVSTLNNQEIQSSNTQSHTSISQQPQPSSTQSTSGTLPTEGGYGGTDAEMGDIASIATDSAVPTGPRAMRGGRNGSRGGPGRVMGQINKAMDRSNESILHRVRPQSGTERVNTHGRVPPTGLKSATPRNNRGTLGRIANNLGATPNPPLMNGPSNSMMPMSPQQQMQIMAMLEQQASMMAQFMPGMVSPAINPDFRNGNAPNQAGKSLFDRVEPRQRNNRKQQQNVRGASKSETEDVSMGEGGKLAAEPSSSMEVENSQESPETSSNTVCHFNLKCIRRDCPYAHQSPAAPSGTTVDVSDVCPFGAACKNFKCTGRHPSPAQKMNFQAEEQCKFFPYCTNPKCPFKHPTMPMCRNGADCTNPGCKFTHLQTHCKFNPCLNPKCPYKHTAGQRGSYADKVWTAEGEQDLEKNHVSERKFVADEDEEEELIKPEAAAGQEINAPIAQTELIT